MAQEQEDFVSNSKFNMMRCLIAISHADGVFHDEEREYLENMMDRLPLSHEQRETLISDFSEQRDIAELFDQIDEPKYRSEVVYFSRLTAHKDGDYDPSEDEMVQHLNELARSKINQNEVRDILKKIKEEGRLEKERIKESYKSPILRWFFDLFEG